MKHWYTNGLPGPENNKVFEDGSPDIPEGWKQGRTMADDFGKNRPKKTPEELAEISAKKRATEKAKYDALSDEEKALLHTQRSERSKQSYQNMSDEQKLDHKIKSSAPHIGTHQTLETKDKISLAKKGKPLSDAQKKAISDTLKAKYASGELVVWNKGTKGLQHWTLDLYEKAYHTKTINKSHTSSQPEIDMYKELCEKYGEENVIWGYRDKRYANPKTGVPFLCDFYIIPEDRFIELNRHWTHGTHPFDPMSLEDISTLEEWEEKIKNGRPKYSLAIDTWTVRDPMKIQVAKDNNLNYDIIY